MSSAYPGDFWHTVALFWKAPPTPHPDENPSRQRPAALPATRRPLGRRDPGGGHEVIDSPSANRSCGSAAASQPLPEVGFKQLTPPAALLKKGKALAAAILCVASPPSPFSSLPSLSPRPAFSSPPQFSIFE